MKKRSRQWVRWWLGREEKHYNEEAGDADERWRRSVYRRHGVTVFCSRKRMNSEHA
ncbi:hypothetical protein A2U01_0112053, partial [Trifolium medium]|nr:hypothetical protein [Trifolium medium]